MNPRYTDLSPIISALDGKASTSHKSTHATGGTDAITPSDIGAAAAFLNPENLPVPEIAYSALELRDNDDFSQSVFKFDGRTPEVWHVERSDKLLEAIGAAAAGLSQGGEVQKANELIDDAQGIVAFKISDYKVTLQDTEFNIDGPNDFLRLQGNFRAAIGAQPAGSYAPASENSPGLAQGAVGLYDEAQGDYALKFSDAQVSFAGELFDLGTSGSFLAQQQRNFRAAISAATAAQGALADTALQPGDAISAASIAVGSASGSLVADLYVGLDGKVGIGTETPSEKLTVSGHIDILGGQVKNLGTPVASTDAASKAYVDGRIPSAPSAGSYILRSVDGVMSWEASLLPLNS